MIYYGLNDSHGFLLTGYSLIPQEILFSSEVSENAGGEIVPDNLDA